jgi:hypothetical protein
VGKLSGRNKTVLLYALVVLLLVSFFSTGGFAALSTYSHAYQGVKSYYYGLYVPPGLHINEDPIVQAQYPFSVPTSGYYVTSYGASTTPGGSISYTPPSRQFGTGLSFDLYDAQYWTCDLIGEQTAPFQPSQQLPDYVPASWFEAAYPTGHDYEWTVDNGDGTSEVVTMTEYVIKWFFSITANYDSGPNIFLGGSDESNQMRYNGVEVWFELAVNENLQYFENQPDQAYFAVAKIQLMNNVKSYAMNRDEEILTATQMQTVHPMSEGSILDIYLNPFGTPDARDATNEYLTYQGQRLNPNHA